MKKVLPWLIATALFTVLTPAIFVCAEAQRGYKAIGGELFLPLLPLLVRLIWGTVQDMFEMLKKELKNESHGEESCG
jgi:hypothetical protein